MHRLALATSSKHPHLTEDDRLLVTPLQEHGLHAESAIWDDPHTDWSRFTAVVIRSCWDYHLKPTAFLEWIASLEAARIPVFNSASLIRWNSDKLYLRDLQAKGIRVVPTFWPEGHEAGSRTEHPFALRDQLRELGWHKAVIKPRISATAHRTQLVNADSADSGQTLFDELRRGPGVMVQKFIESVSSEGEWSVIFFGGTFSHAILKKPQAEDFRVQNDFGGTSQPADPPSHVLASATRAVQAVEPIVYARVDGVVDDTQFHLMELELIEPMLFLADHPEAANRFAGAIAQALAAD
jgi:glutathione synthase/RimK-type ligase-like ATP-grasp enzyme